MQDIDFTFPAARNPGQEESEYAVILSKWAQFKFENDEFSSVLILESFNCIVFSNIIRFDI